ncbi:ATP-synt_Fo_b domain containing protein [Acidimicrobiia bacterium]
MASEFSVPIDPDRIVSQTFATVRRGLDPLEVQRFLLVLSNELRDARSRETTLRLKIEELDRRAEPTDPLDPSHLTKLLGQETVRVLDAAQSAAAEIRAKAEEGVARLLRESRDEAQLMRDEAESLLKLRSAEANEAADEIRAQSAQMLEHAQEERAEILEVARNEGRQMITEAQELRERMLDDLARRRKLLRQQIEQLQAGRDRLAAAYDVVRDTLDVATEELHVALPEAKLAAEAAALKATESSSSEELLSAIELGTLAVVPPAADAEPDTSPAELHAVETPTPTPTPTLTIVSSPVPKRATPTVAIVPDPESEALAEPTAGAPADPIVEAEGKTPGTTDIGSSPPAPEDSTDDSDVRQSSSVRVVRKARNAGSSEKDDLFARLRSEAPVESEATDTEVERAEVIEPVGAVAVDVDDDADMAGVFEEKVKPIAEAVISSDGAGERAHSLVVQRDAAILELDKSLSRRLKRELSDEQNELLSALSSTKGSVSAISVLPSQEVQEARYSTLADPVLAQAAAAGSELVSGIGGRGGSRSSLADLASELAAEIVGPLRERLERCFAESDGDRDEVAQRIRSCYREWKAQRVEPAASHAMVAACNRGAFDRLPKKTMVRWVVSDGAVASPDCGDNALAGDLAKGDKFPTGHVNAPIHDNCRCFVAPVELLS